MKKILVLTGSPRTDGNTFTLADAFIKGAKESGNEVMRFDAGLKKINPCIACNACFTEGKACIQNDDFNELAALIEKAEIIVFVTPLYWYSFPSQIKAAIDKMYSFLIGNKELKLEGAMLISCCGDGTEEAFEGMVKSYRMITDYLKIHDMGKLLVTSAQEKGYTKTGTFCKMAEEMGKKIK